MKIGYRIILSLAVLSQIGISYLSAINVDSLLALSYQNKVDTNVINTMNNEAFKLRISNDSISRKLASEALKNAEKLKFPKGQAEALNVLGILDFKKANYKTASDYLNRAIEINETNNYLLGMADNMGNLANVKIEQGQYISALSDYMKALDIYKKLNLKKRQASTLANIASRYLMMGSFVKAVELNYEALEIFQELKDTISQAYILGNLANMYLDINDMELALKSQTNAYELSKGIGNQYLQLINCVGLGNIYRKLGNIDSSLFYYKLALDLSLSSGNMSHEAIIYGNIAMVYKDQQSYPQALMTAKKAIQLLDKLQNQRELSANLLNLGDIYSLLRDNEASLKSYHQSLDIANEAGLLIQSRNAHSALYKYYEKAGIIQKAYTHYKQFVSIRDSISNVESEREMLKQRFDFELNNQVMADSLKTMAEIERLSFSHNLELSQRKSERNLFASAGILFLLISFIFFQRKISRNKLLLKEQEAAYQKEVLYATINSQETERRRIARDLHDEVGAMLATIKLNLGSVNIKLRQVGFEDDIVAPARNLVDDTISNVRSISKNLLPPTLEEFGLAHALSELADKVQEASGINIEKDIQLSVNRLEVERELAIFRIIQEMMNNALKHSSATMFKLVLKESNGQLDVMFSDNGVGFDLNAIKNSKSGQTGMGLKNLENRAGAAGAEIQLSSLIGQGTKLSLKLPVQFKAQYAA